MQSSGQRFDGNSACDSIVARAIRNCERSLTASPRSTSAFKSCAIIDEEKHANMKARTWIAAVLGSLLLDGRALARDKQRLRPGQLMVFCENRNIRLRDFTIRDSPCWGIFLYGSEDGATLFPDVHMRVAEWLAGTRRPWRNALGR